MACRSRSRRRRRGVDETSTTKQRPLGLEVSPSPSVMPPKTPSSEARSPQDPTQTRQPPTLNPGRRPAASVPPHRRRHRSSSDSSLGRHFTGVPRSSRLRVQTFERNRYRGCVQERCNKMIS